LLMGSTVIEIITRELFTTSLDNQVKLDEEDNFSYPHKNHCILANKPVADRK
jgi:hypothetical protein